MGAIVGKLWVMSLQACVLIFIVLIARYFLRRYPKIYSYWLWALVGVRLLCPIWIESPFSLQPELPDSLGLALSGTALDEPGLAEGLPGLGALGASLFDSGLQGAGAPVGLPGSESADGTQKGDGSGDGQSGRQDLQGGGWILSNGRQGTKGGFGIWGGLRTEGTELGSEPGSEDPENSNSWNPNSGSPDSRNAASGASDSRNAGSGNTNSGDAGFGDSDAAAGILGGGALSRLLVIFYLLGVGTACGIYLVQYVLVKRRLAIAVHEGENIWLCENVQTPFVIGLFRSRIILPYGFDEFEKTCVLKHERTHIRHHDPLIRFAGLLCTCLHWWNPLVWLAVHKMNQDMEMFCDESALLGATLEERKSYASTLLSCAKKQSGFLVGLAFGESNTERRVKNIMKKRKGSVIIIGLVALLSIFCAVTLMTAPKNKQQEENAPGEDGRDPSGQGGTPEDGGNLTPTPVPSVTPAPTGELTPEPTPTPAPTGELTEATPSATPSAAAALTPQADAVPTNAAPTDSPQADATPTDPPPFDPAASYLKISPEEDMAVYFNEGKDTPQVIVEWTDEGVTRYKEFEWDYNLDYGTPIVAKGSFGFSFMEAREVDPETLAFYEENGDADSLEYLKRGKVGTKGVWRIILPTAKLAEPLDPLGAAEFRGVGHTVSLGERIAEVLPTEALYIDSREWPELEPGKLYGIVTINDAFYQRFLKYSTAGYRANGDGEEVFTLSLCGNGALEQYFEYPGLPLPEQDTYPIVIDELSHFTAAGIEYRRFGIKAGEAVVWLGKLRNDITSEVGWMNGDGTWNGDYLFFPDREIGYYAGRNGRGGIPAEGDLQEGMPYRLEPEDTFDLDGDGIPERIEYRNTQNADDPYTVDSVLLMNGREVLRKEFRVFDPVADYAYIASLDGKAYQFLILNFRENHTCFFEIYQYADGELRYAGEFADASYVPVMEDGKRVFYFTTGVHPLHNDFIERKYEYAEGSLREIPQEYYEFLMMYGEEGETLHRPVFTAKEEIALYREKGGSETFQLSAGCRVSTIGGDLKEWLLLENVDTGERGWIRVDWNDGYAFFCILPDGRSIDCDELFDGLNAFRAG